jgi:hypothetical protein
MSDSKRRKVMGHWKKPKSTISHNCPFEDVTSNSILHTVVSAVKHNTWGLENSYLQALRLVWHITH